jgi:hemerythrin-like metal-binding protein
MVPIVEWRRDFEIGIPDVDHEHREIVGLVNELSCVLESDGSSVAMQVLGDIYAHIAAHFALEERVMRERGYDEYQEHKADHARLLDDLRDLMDDFEAGRWMDRDAFAGRVADWFSVHFRTRDARLHRAIG